ncbi:CorA family divalent cation transporter [Streptacidiphilus sp. PAMC 29251]
MSASRTTPPPAERRALLLGPGGSRPAKGGDPAELLRQAQAQDSVLWLVLDAEQGEHVHAAGQAVGLDREVVEAALASHQRPRLHPVGDATVLFLRTCRLSGGDGDAASGLPRVRLSGGVVLVTAPGVALLVEHGRPDLGTALEQHFDRIQVTASDPTAVLELVARAVVDGYEEVAEALENAVEEADPEPEDGHPVQGAQRRAQRRLRHRRLAAAHHLHRQIFRLRRAAGPAALAFDAVAAQLPDDAGQGRGSLRETSNRLRHVVSQSEQLSELLDSARDAWSAEVSVSQNDDMRRIGAVAALVAVPTLVVGNYGMNFDHMPELHWVWGYPMVVLATVAICAALYVLFHRLEWL